MSDTTTHTDRGPRADDGSPPADVVRPREGRLPFGSVERETLERAGIDELDFRVVSDVLDVMRAMTMRLEDTAAAFDLNAQTLLALRHLDAPLSQKDVAAALGCDPSYVTAIVDRLEELGAVERTPDPSDRRVKRVVLTEEGRRLRIETGVHLLRAVPALLGLDDVEVAQLAGLLRKVVDANAEALTRSWAE